MTTTFKDTMSHPAPHGHIRRSIIAAGLALAMLLSSCGFAIRLGYNQGSSLAFRWLDGYAEFDDAQSLAVRTALDDWFAWHRRTQLPDYADLLAKAGVEMQGNLSAERTCAWAHDLRARFDTGLERAMPALSAILPTLKPAQIAHIEQRNEKRNGEYRDDFLQRDPAKRRKEAVKREIERAEDLYGRLDATQRAFVVRHVEQSPWDGELSYAERLRRQQDAVQAMRRMAAGPATREQAEAEIRAYVQRIDRSPNEAYRAYAQRLTDHNCEFAAALHNLTSAEQRQRAVKKLRGYEQDARILAAEASG